MQLPFMQPLFMANWHKGQRISFSFLRYMEYVLYMPIWYFQRMYVPVQCACTKARRASFVAVRPLCWPGHCALHQGRSVSSSYEIYQNGRLEFSSSKLKVTRLEVVFSILRARAEVIMLIIYAANAFNAVNETTKGDRSFLPISVPL